MRFIIRLLILLLIMLMNPNPCLDIEEGMPNEDENITSLEVGDAADGRFEGIWGDRECHYYKVTVPEDADRKQVVFRFFNYAESPVNYSLYDEKGWILDEKTGIRGNLRKLNPGRTYYIKVEKRFYPTKGRYILSVSEVLDDRIIFVN